MPSSRIFVVKVPVKFCQALSCHSDSKVFAPTIQAWIRQLVLHSQEFFGFVTLDRLWAAVGAVCCTQHPMWGGAHAKLALRFSRACFWLVCWWEPPHTMTSTWLWRFKQPTLGLKGSCLVFGRKWTKYTLAVSTTFCCTIASTGYSAF